MDSWEIGARVRLTGEYWESHNSPKIGDEYELVSGPHGNPDDEYWCFYIDGDLDEWHVYTTSTKDWGGELVNSSEVIEMTRLQRDRKGKTPIDVGIVKQDDLTRVRLSMGDDGKSRKNSDLSIKETEDLITMLSYNLAVAKGDIEIT